MSEFAQVFAIVWLAVGSLLLGYILGLTHAIRHVLKMAEEYRG